MNSSVTGPYLPNYVKDDWVECFTSKLDDQVKISGISINHFDQYRDPYAIGRINSMYGLDGDYSLSHVQSMTFCLDRQGLEILINYGLFREGKEFPADKYELTAELDRRTTLEDRARPCDIHTCEMAMTVLILNEGYAAYGLGLDMGQGPIRKNETYPISDLWSENVPRRQLFETMFIKNNRNLVFEEEARYNKWSGFVGEKGTSGSGGGIQTCNVDGGGRGLGWLWVILILVVVIVILALVMEKTMDKDEERMVGYGGGYGSRYIVG